MTDRTVQIYCGLALPEVADSYVLDLCRWNYLYAFQITSLPSTPLAAGR
jgi:hypothetical protein